MAYREEEARQVVIEACHRLVREKLIARTWGNVSARISAEEFIITPSGRSYEDMKPEDLVKVRIQDLKWEGDRKPSSEKGIHAAAYRLRADANIVIHTHQLYASAVSTEGKHMDGAPCAGYGLPGTKALRKQVEKTIREFPIHRAFLMERHGVLVLGNTPEEAFSEAETLEDRCRALVSGRIFADGFRPHLKRHPKAEAKLVADLSAEYGCAVVVRDEYVADFMGISRDLPAVVDDFAQIIGPNARKSLPMEGNVRHALKDRNAVLVKGIGAICVGKDRMDAEAAAMILQKNCIAALYAAKLRPMGAFDSRIQRWIYLKKYSKQI